MKLTYCLKDWGRNQSIKPFKKNSRDINPDFMEISLNLLLVGDSHRLPELIFELLKPTGINFGCECVETGENLRAAIPKHSWDLIIAEDRPMSFDASDALSVCREMGFEKPFIVLAKEYSKEYVTALMESGAADYVTMDQVERLVPAIIRELKESKFRNNRFSPGKTVDQISKSSLSPDDEKILRDAMVSKSGNWEYNLETGMISASAGAQKLYGIKGDHWKYEEIKLIPLPEYRELLDNGLSELINNGSPYDFEFKIRQPNTDQIIDIQSIAEYNPSKKILIGVINDITDRKKIEEALLKSEEKYRLLIENQGEGVGAVDLNEIFVFANPAADQMFGVPKGTLVNRSLLDFVVPEHLPRIKEETARRAMMQKSSYEIEIVSNTCEIHHILVTATPQINEKGKITGTLGIFRDITERKQIEDKLRILSETVEQNPTSIVVTDSKGKIEFANNAFVKLTQYPLSEVINKSPRIFNRGNQPNQEFDLMWDLLMEGKVWKGEYQNRRKDKSKYWEDVTISSLRNSTGEISNFILIMDDISEKKKMVDDLILAKETAEESDRLKSAFLAMMNHELRTPLTHILGFSELIMSGIAPDENISFASSIQSSGQNLLSIIEGVFDLALMEQAEIKIVHQTFSIMDLYMENKASLDHILRTSAKHTQIKLIFRPDTHWLSSYATTDRGKINQILTNLFKNAVKFTRAGSIEFGFKIENESYLTFYIKDTGIGIPEEKQSIIFDYFRQIDDSYTRVYEGIGVGLAISKKIANLLKGELKVNSSPGQGSIFSLMVPVELSYIKE